MDLYKFCEPDGWGGNLELLKTSRQTLDDLGCRITLTHDKITDAEFQIDLKGKLTDGQEGEILLKDRQVKVMQAPDGFRSDLLPKLNDCLGKPTTL